MADNEGIQIKEILAKADGGCPKSEDFEAAYNGYVFGPDGKAKERPNVYIAEKLRLTNQILKSRHYEANVYGFRKELKMSTFTESGFRGFLSAFLPPLTSRDPAVAPQQRVILMGGLGPFNFQLDL